MAELKVGLAKIAKIEMLKTNADKPYCNGNLIIFGEDSSMPFKAWEEASPQNLFEIVSNGKRYLKIQYEETQYKNSTYLTIKQYKEMTEEEVNKSFLKKIHEEQKELNKRLERVIDDNVSSTGKEFLNKFIEKNPEIWERFLIEQAAVGKHDASPVGLLRHTTKMLEFLEMTMKTFKDFHLNQTGKDLIYLGLLLHDIGKVLEYYEGQSTHLAKVTHRGLGIELVVLNKEIFLEYYSSDWYYEFIGIINQHHGVYEERPHSFFSYFVHLIDMFDTHMTGMYESLLSNKNNDTLRVLDKDIPLLAKEHEYFNFND